MQRNAEPRSCDIESIHLPGSIQPHGVLLLFGDDSGDLLRWAGDVERYIGINPSVGLHFSGLLGVPFDSVTANQFLIPGAEALYIGTVRPPGKEPLSIIAHRIDRLIAIELEPSGQTFSGTEALGRVGGLSRMIGGMETFEEACECAAEQVRAVIGYDRVMVYRFLQDASGSVIAEARCRDAISFLNHRFPASDIPVQARALYARSLVRVIPDASFKPAPLMPSGGDQLDMSHCVLRSVSPVHLEYLRNMEVGASMSISIMVEGSLWGLIACHNAKPRFVPVDAQLLCRHTGTTLASYILANSAVQRAQLGASQSAALEAGLLELRSSEDPERALRTSPEALLDLVECSGVALIAGGTLVGAAGRLPEAERLLTLVPFLEDQLSSTGSYWTDRLPEAFAEAAPISAEAGGILAIRIETSPAVIVCWLRSEQIEEIQWAGNPNEQEALAGLPKPLTPRRSFATWRETVRGRSRPWSWSETDTAEQFRSRANFILQQQQLTLLNQGLADANTQLEVLAATDPLTGLANRRSFEQRLGEEWSRAIRKSMPLALLAVDVDNFKLYNDRFGHPAGDECLCKIASALRLTGRVSDLTGRLGGEEFALLLPEVDESRANAIAERLRAGVERLQLDHPLNPGGVVTISIGIACGIPAAGKNPLGALEAADKALYEAKNAGRNRVASAGAEAWL